jgi:hypothetical protein
MQLVSISNGQTFGDVNMRMKMKLLSLSAVTFLAINNWTVGAQTAEDMPKIDSLTPLSDYLNRPENSQAVSYPFIRCAGLLLGFTYYGGLNFDLETSTNTANTIQALRNTAIIVNAQKVSERGGTTIEGLSEESFATISRDTWNAINSIAFFYNDRFQMNFASNGAAFGEDAMITEDFEVCARFFQVAVDFMKQ